MSKLSESDLEIVAKVAAETSARVIAGVLEAQRALPVQLPPEAADPRSALYQMRKGGPAHDLGEIVGELAWQDRTNVASHPGTGSIAAKGRVRVRYDRTKDPRGLIYEVVEDEGSTEPVINFLDGSFRKEKDEAYRLSVDSPEHLAELEKQRVRYIQQNLYYRFRLTVLNAMIGRTLEDPEVRMIFTPDAPAAEKAAE
jgi:hypothetical protein